MSLAEGNDQAFVKAFNELPRPQTSPDGKPNHWHITIQTLPLDPDDDLVFLVRPSTGNIHLEGKTKIKPLPSPTTKAKVIAPLLLESFVVGMNSGRHGEPIPGVSRTAPRSWGTRDRKLAKALEEYMKKIGVRKELCTVQAGSEADEKLAQKKWDTWSEELVMEAFKHPIVLAIMAGQSKSRDDDAFEDYNRVAKMVPAAKDLAESVNLNLQWPDDARQGIFHPIRRLVITGKDTDENMSLLFGPHWREIAGPMHINARQEVLLQPSPGSPQYVLYSRWDKNRPYWSPRPPTEQERILMDICQQRYHANHSHEDHEFGLD
ncbi:hypothetical protein AWENTII_004384 [Aspergillus wentii]